MSFGIGVLVSGERACFTRPEMKVERVSYDVITPSAARGIIEAVYWKPAIRWRIDRITVLNEIKFDTFRRNELKTKITNIARPIDISNIDNRAQRATLYLRHVSYLVDAHFEMTGKAGPDDTVEKHYNIALRRLRRGQCFNQPVLGCREFPAKVELLEDDDARKSLIEQGFYFDSGERDLGYMLYDIDFEHDMEPMFFRAKMVDGTIDTRFDRSGVTR